MALLSSLLLAALAAPAAAAPRPHDSTTVTVTVDSARHEVVVRAGPFDLENMPPMPEHMMDHGATHDTPVHRFAWPVEGWMRGFRIELADAAGNPVPRHVMHHMIMVNFSRRQLLYSAAERLLGAGTETDDAVVPKSIGVPMTPGSDLGMYVAWHNDTGEDLHGVYLTLRMLWTPTNQVPRPLDALPIYMDVNLTVGGTNTYDVPPGRSEKGYEFTLPVGGRLLGVGGHLHDYGVEVRLEDAESGKVLTRVKAERDDSGRVAHVSRELFGIRGSGLKLRSGHRYRVVGVYDNPTGETLIHGAMAHMVGLFVPERLDDWPALDPEDPTFRQDILSLELRGAGDAEHEHGDEAQQHEGGQGAAAGAHQHH